MRVRVCARVLLGGGAVCALRARLRGLRVATELHDLRRFTAAAIRRLQNRLRRRVSVKPQEIACKI